MSEATREESEFFEEVRQRAEELSGMLDDFSSRLRRMRQRNRQMEEEIQDFEQDLARVRDRLAEHLSDSSGGETE